MNIANASSGGASPAAWLRSPPSTIPNRVSRTGFIYYGLTIFLLRGLPRAGLIPTRQRWNGREVKLDPEERIIAAAQDEAEFDDANDRGACARIEFMREGHARVTITISRELVRQARVLDFTTGELFAEAIRLAVPGAFEFARPLPKPLH